MNRDEFERHRWYWLRAIILGLVLALSCASLSCKSGKATAEEEAEDSEDKGAESAASGKKAKAKDEHKTDDKAQAEKQAPGAKAEDKKSATGDKHADQAPKHEAPKPPMSPEQALARLKAGNEAFLNGSLGISHLTAERRSSLAAGQHPFAIILSCSDSRVPPEQVFSQGLGDLFTVRVAGNIADPATVASIEYAAAHLGVPLLVVMGHTECGAVKAAIAGAHDTPSIIELVKAIHPAIEGLPKEALASDTERAVRANVHQVRGEIMRQSQLLNGLAQEKKLKLAEAVYDLKTGQVKFLK